MDESKLHPGYNPNAEGTFWGKLPRETRNQSPGLARVRAMLEQQLQQDMQREPTQFEDPYPPEEREALLKEMQRKHVLGQALLASGDKPLGELGRSLTQRDPADFEAGLNRQDQVRRYQQWQADQTGNRTRTLTQALKAMEEVGPGQGRQDKIPSSQLTNINLDKTYMRGLSRASNTFKPVYTQSLGRRMQAEGFVPKTIEELASWAASSVPGLLNEDEKRAAEWWADLDRDIFAAMRNDLFGATLTPNEKAAFDALRLMTPAMSPDQIQRRLDSFFSAAQSGARDRIVATVGNYGEGHIPWISELFGPVLDRGVPDRTPGAGVTIERASGPAAPAAGGAPAGGPALPQGGAPAQPQGGLRAGRMGVPIEIEEVADE